MSDGLETAIPASDLDPFSREFTLAKSLAEDQLVGRGRPRSGSDGPRLVCNHGVDDAARPH